MTNLEKAEKLNSIAFYITTCHNGQSSWRCSKSVWPLTPDVNTGAHEPNNKHRKITGRVFFNTKFYFVFDGKVIWFNTCLLSLHGINIHICLYIDKKKIPQQTC